MERHYGGHLCYGPPIEEGFFYDMHLQDRFVQYKLKIVAMNSLIKAIALQICLFQGVKTKTAKLFILGLGWSKIYSISSEMPCLLNIFQTEYILFVAHFLKIHAIFKHVES